MHSPRILHYIAPSRDQPISAILPLSVRYIPICAKSMLLNIELYEMFDCLQKIIVIRFDTSKVLSEWAS